MPTTTSMDNLADQASSGAGAFYTTMTQEVVPYPVNTATNSSSSPGIVSFKVYNNSPPTTTGGVSDVEDADDWDVDTGMTNTTPANADTQAQLRPESSSTPSDTPGEPLPTSAPTNSSPVKNGEPMESSQPPPLAPNPSTTPGEPLPTPPKKTVKFLQSE